MIRRGGKGRVSGLYLAENLVGSGIAGLSEDCFLKTETGNDLLKLHFQEKEAIQDPEIRRNLPELSEALVYLLYFAEKDPALSLSFTAEDEEAGETYTGMRTFLLLSEGKFSIHAEKACVRAFLTEEMEAVPGAEDFVRAFVRCLFRFSQEEALPLVFGGKAAEENEINIPSGTRETLSELKEMFATLEDHTADAEEKAFQPFAYAKGQAVEGPGYRLFVPDDCVYRLQEDGHDFILWRPNEENPGEWEAAPFILVPGDRFPMGEADQERIFFREDTASAVLLYEKPLASAVQRFALEFRAYAPDKKEDYLRTAVCLFAHIEIREA